MILADLERRRMDLLKSIVASPRGAGVANMRRQLVIITAAILAEQIKQRRAA